MNEEFHPGISPVEQAKLKEEKGEQADVGKAEWDTIIGLESAIEATQKRIIEYRESRASTSDLEEHLSSLRERFLEGCREAIKATQGRIVEHKARGVDAPYLDGHLKNLNDKLSKMIEDIIFKKAA